MRKFLKKYLPSNEKIAENKSLNSLTSFFNDSRLWGLNRRSVSMAVAIGLFTSMLPIPMQMLVAALLAIFFHSNLPIAVIGVWITNPLTMPIIFYGNYKFGAWLLSMQYQSEPNMPFFQWLNKNIQDILPPLILGSVLMGIILAIVSYILVRLIWSWSIRRRWYNRSKRILETLKEKQIKLDNLKLNLHKKDMQNQVENNIDNKD